MNANELPDAKLLRKKLKNGLIVDKWDLVTIIEKQEAMLRQQQAEIEALKDCLKFAHDDTIDYIKLNNLGGENNHWLVWARKLLK